MIRIYFDTNILEKWKNKNIETLHKCDISNNYYDIVNFINNNNLEDKVCLNIPLIVIMEIKQHLYQSHKNKCQSLKDTITDAQMSFRSILDISYEFKYKDHIDKQNLELDKEIDTFVDKIIQDFRDLPINAHLKITKYPEKYNTLIDRAITEKPPFFKHGKVTDAGFKDALLLESIQADEIATNDTIILFTLDKIFAKCEETACKDYEFTIVESTDQCINIMRKKFNIETIDTIKRRLQDDQYILQRLFEEISQPFSEDTDKLEIEECHNVGTNEYLILAHAISNETVYLFEFDYDDIINEPVNITYTIKNT